MPQKDVLRIGVIGAGGRGYLAMHAHKPDAGSRLVAGMDIAQPALEQFRKDYGPDIFTTTDYRKLLERDDVDAVFITSPDFVHEEQAIAALEAGKAVYLEKPMAITIEGCDRILATAVRTKTKLYLGHNLRHFPVIQKMKQLIDAGAIGQVKSGWCRHFVSYGGDAYFKDWHADRSKSTGLLLQKGAHDIDALHFMCGGNAQRVVAMGGLSVYNQIADRHPASEVGDADMHEEFWPPLSQKQLNPVLDVEDLSMMLMQLDNGVQCSYQQCHYTPDCWRNYTIIGTEGRIENFADHGKATIRLWNKRRDNYVPEGNENFELEPEAGSHGGADAKIVAEFIDFVRNDGPVTTSPIAARYTVAAGCLATESLRNGSRPMDVPPVGKEVIRHFA